MRRRAALAIGRAGLSEGIAPLATALATDAEPEVRAMAAFALGLIGDAAAAPALLPALGDADPRVQGRAAEAFGLIGHVPAAGSIAGMALAHVKAGALAGVASDDETWPLAPAVEALRLGVYALVRLEAIDELRAVVIGADGAPVSDWWPLAYAMQRVGKPAALPTLRAWLGAAARPRAAFAARGLGTLKDAESRVALEALVKDESQTTGVRVQAMRALAAIGDRRSAAVLAPLVAKASSNTTRTGSGGGTRRRGRSGGGRDPRRLSRRRLGADAGRLAGRARQGRSRDLHDGALGPRRRSGLARAVGAGGHARHAAP